MPAAGNLLLCSHSRALFHGTPLAGKSGKTCLPPFPHVHQAP
ncbi:hypothetical protein HMPREF3039_02637 [Akkermansia sp. KLE1798]|nr:hypothetical protein HMPREF3039_02637 [Akkermansia sp. KLE1798]KZA05332.1 hypothetical protein HMPREF1326_00946 [Akkermansia sp. KLE1605]